MPYSSGTESESALFWLRGFGGAAFLTLDGLRLVGWEVLCQAVLPLAGEARALVLNTAKIGGTMAVGAFHDLLCFVHRATYIGASETCLVGSEKVPQRVSG